MHKIGISESKTKPKSIEKSAENKFIKSKTNVGKKTLKTKNATKRFSPSSVKLFKSLIKNYLIKTGCNKCFGIDLTKRSNQIKYGCYECTREELLMKQADCQEDKWDIVRYSVLLDYSFEQCTNSKTSCKGNKCKNAHNKVELNVWNEARRYALISLSELYLDLIESNMYAKLMLQYFIINEGYAIELLCKQCLLENNKDLVVSASKKRHMPFCKNGHYWDNVAISFVKQDGNGQKRYWFADNELAPKGSQYYNESITVCINEIKYNENYKTDEDIFALAEKITFTFQRSRKSEKHSQANDVSSVEITTLSNDDMNVDEDLFYLMNNMTEREDDDIDDYEATNSNFKNNRANYYEIIPAKEAFKLKEANPANFKWCRVKLEGIYNTIATPIDENFPPIQIHGRMNCGPCFDGDEVIVELLHVKKLDSEKHISEYERDQQLKSNKISTNVNLETTIQHGRVKSIVKQVRKRRGSVFICTVDEYQSNLMKPVCGTVPKIHLINGALYSTLDKEDVDNHVALYTMVHDNFKMKKIVKLNEKDRQDKLFVVCIIKWSKTHMYPLGYAMSSMSQGTDQASSQRIIDYACNVPKRYIPDTLSQLGINISDAMLNMFSNREDLRNDYVVTIDPPDCQDVDDALSLLKRDDHYVIGVHIADVSFFIPKGSKLDKEAFRRCRTYYPKVKDGPIHMLPAELSENFCSLLPDRDRPCISVMISVDFEGKILSHKIVRTIIQSKQKLSYSEVQQILCPSSSIEINSNERLKTMLLQLNDVAQLLRKERLGKARHYFQFENSIKSNGGHDFTAHFLVEEFMILANAYVADYLYKKFPDCIPLRIQGHPDNCELDEWFKNYSHCSNIALFIQSHAPSICHSLSSGNASEVPLSHVPLLKEIGTMLIEASQKNNARRIREIIGAEQFHPLHSVALSAWLDIQRSAEFACSGTRTLSDHSHFALGKTYYTQFTSPIRRYMDIVVHRLLVSSLLDSTTAIYSKEEIHNICEHVNLLSSNAKKYEKFCNSLATAISLQPGPAYFARILVDIGENNFCFNFPELCELTRRQKSVTFSSLDVCEKPIISERHENCQTQILLKWKRRIYDAEHDECDVKHTSKGDRLKSDKKNPVCLSQNYHVRKVPLNEWLQVVDALDSESDQRLIENVRQIIPYLEKNPVYAEITSEVKDSKIVHHHVPFTLQLENSATMYFQFGAESVRGILQPVITVLNLTPEYNLCVQHMNDAIKCFSDVAVRKVKDQYDSIEEYQDIWLPIIDMEAAYAAVQDANPITIKNVTVSLQENEDFPNQYYGKFFLDRMFCKERCINLLKNSKDEEEDMHDYLCLKFPLSSCKYDHTIVKENVWVCHALAQHGAVADNNNDDSSNNGKQFCVDFVVHHFATKPPKELLSNAELKCVVELLTKPSPHR